MNRGLRRMGYGLAIAMAVALGGGLPAGPRDAAAAGEGVTVAFQQKLPNAPGKTLSGILVDYAPGAKSKPHWHRSGAVVAYVLSGAIRSQVEGGPARVYRAGESRYEPPGSHHVVSENASAEEPARLLAVFVAEDGAVLTEFDE